VNREVLLNSLEEFMEETDARLTALEAAKTQAPESVSQLRALVDENHRLEMAVYHAKADLDEAEAENERLNGSVQELTRQRNALAAERDDLLELCNGLDQRLTDELDAARAERDNLAAERKRLDAENAMLAAEIDDLTRQRNALAAQVDDLRNVNAGLRKDNERLAAEVSLRTEEIESVQTDCETHKAQRDALRIAMSDAATAIRRLTDDNTRQHELVAALRQNSADLVIAIQALQAETA
jgi:chromosome segregation ATPase